MLNRIIRSVATVLIGLLLVFMPDGAMGFIVRVVGAAFFVPAMVSLVKLYVSRRETAALPMVAVGVVGLGCAAFGLWLMVAPETFAGLFVTLLGVALLLFALFQLFVLFAVKRSGASRWGFVVVPLLLVVASVVVLANPFETVTAVSVLLGVCAVLSGISDILIYTFAGVKKSAETPGK